MSAPVSPDPIWILYGTHTGNCERLAQVTRKRLDQLGVETRLYGMQNCPVHSLPGIRRLLVIVSTHGAGEPPSQASGFYDFLFGDDAPRLDKTKFAVLALGDTGYVRFCQTGKDFDRRLEQLGARRMIDRMDCDIDYAEDYQRWWESVVDTFIRPGRTPDASLPATGAEDSAVTGRSRTIRSQILRKQRLAGEHTRPMLHLELDLAGSGITYEPGDTIGISAPNPEPTVSRLLDILKFSGREPASAAEPGKKLADALRDDYELSPLTYASLARYAELAESEKLRVIANDPAAAAAYLYGRDVCDLLQETPRSMSPDELLGILRKNTPRLYSVASCQAQVGGQADLLVSVVDYEAYGTRKYGLCSTYLHQSAGEGDFLDIFRETNDTFRLPADPLQPVVMIGTGAGIAPYRAFLQKRALSGHTGGAWLFFGERYRAENFYYRTEWIRYLQEKILSRLDLAFSRDGPGKVYVQHKMEEHGRLLFEWIENGAVVYVCGDARRMAPEVERAFVRILQQHGSLNRVQAEEHLQYLRISGRYLTDVY